MQSAEDCRVGCKAAFAGHTSFVDRRPVICAFEPSGPARLAAHMAAWLAEQLQAPLELIHVFDAGAQPALPRDGLLKDPVIRGDVADRLDDRTRALALRL